MIKDDKRVRLFIGHYGSGKSEVSINYVTQLRKMVDGEVSFADLDIVNVYFRTREKKEQLRAMGINPIDSSIETDTLDLPAVSAQVMTPLHEKNVDYVLDVGGDNVGTRVDIGSFLIYFVEVHS